MSNPPKQPTNQKLILSEPLEYLDDFNFLFFRFLFFGGETEGQGKEVTYFRLYG